MKAIFSASALLITFAQFSSTAEARTIPAVHAKVADPAQASCAVANGGAGLYNQCNANVTVKFALPIDSAGTKNIRASVWAGSMSQQVYCRSAGMNENSTIGGWSGWANLPGPTYGAQGFTWSQSLTNGQSLVVECLMNAYTTITMFNYTP